MIPRHRPSLLLSVIAISLSTLVTGCGGGDEESSPTGERRATELGRGDHSPTSVTFTEIATKADKLSYPRDLAFNPLRPDELWIVSAGDGGMVIVHDASTDGRRAERLRDPAASHFMPNPSSIAFGDEATRLRLIDDVRELLGPATRPTTASAGVTPTTTPAVIAPSSAPATP